MTTAVIPEAIVVKTSTIPATHTVRNGHIQVFLSNAVVKVICPYCEEYHFHGANHGIRSADCGAGDYEIIDKTAN